MLLFNSSAFKAYRVSSGVIKILTELELRVCNAVCSNISHVERRVCSSLAVHGARQEEVIDHRLTDREWAEEWKHLDNVRVNIVALLHAPHFSIHKHQKANEKKKRIKVRYVGSKVSFRAGDDMPMTVTGTVADSLCPI